jgi:hypothetical protein
MFAIFAAKFSLQQILKKSLRVLRGAHTNFSAEIFLIRVVAFCFSIIFHFQDFSMMHNPQLKSLGALNFILKNVIINAERYDNHRED